MVLRNPPYGRNQHYALEGLNSNPHLKWGCVTKNLKFVLKFVEPRYIMFLY